MFCFDVLYRQICDEMLMDPLDPRDFGTGVGDGLPPSALAPDPPADTRGLSAAWPERSPRDRQP